MAKSKKEFEYEYDPIKEIKGGEKAKAVVWSTKSLEAAVDGLSKGLPLKANPFIGPNTKLLKPDLVYKRTKEELEDYMKCMEDPAYFATKCYIIHPTGLQKAVLRDYQIDYLHHLQTHRFSIMLACRQAGKCVFFTTTSNFVLPNSLILDLLENKRRLIDNILKRYSYYIDKDGNYIVMNLPLFELQNLFDNSFIWKMKYIIYKAIYNIANK